MNPLIELLKEHPEFADKPLAEVYQWLLVQQEEARVELEMYERELAEGQAAFNALEPYMPAETTTTAEALAIMRRVEGADSPKVKAVETFITNHPWMKIGGAR